MDDKRLEQSHQPAARVEIPLSLDSALWGKFRRIVEQQYRRRTKHPSRPSYGKLLEDAIDGALILYIDQCKELDTDKGQASQT